MKDQHAENRFNDAIKHWIQIGLFPLFYTPLGAAFLEHRGVIHTGWPLHVIANIALFTLIGLVGATVLFVLCIYLFRLFKYWNSRNELAELSNTIMEGFVGFRDGGNSFDFSLIVRTIVFFGFLFLGGMIAGAYSLVGLIGITLAYHAVIAFIAQRRWWYLAVYLPRKTNWGQP